MDRRDLIKAAAITTIGGSASGIDDALADSNTTANIQTVASIDPRITELNASFDYMRYIQLLASQVASEAGAAVSDLPPELVPIDIGAVGLLKDQTNARLKYSPFEVEYLLQTADAAMRKCLELRDQAQQIELLWIANRSEILMDRALQSFTENLNTLASTNENNILGTMYKPSLGGAQAAGDESPSAKKYLADKMQFNTDYNNTTKIVTEGKSAAATRPGGGANLHHRFSIIKQEFERTLKDAYARAMAASFGLINAYKVTDHPLPAVDNDAYSAKLANWIAEAVTRLERVQFSRSRSTVVIPLRKTLVEGNEGIGLMSEADFQAARNSGVFSFKIDNDKFSIAGQKLANVRMLGLDVFAWVELSSGGGTDLKFRSADYFQFIAQFPQNKIVAADGTQVWNSSSEIVFPVSPYPEGRLSAENRQEVYNLDPTGDWIVKTNKLSYFGRKVDNDSVLKNVLLVINVSHDAV